jgi:hypothetical protein
MCGQIDRNERTETGLDVREKKGEPVEAARASDAALDAAGAVCFDATGDKIPPPARRSSRPPSNSNASVDSPLSPAPSGIYGVGFWPMPLCIGPPHFLWRPAPDKAQGVGAAVTQYAQTRQF